jgi:hypothetical protein
MRRRRLAQHRRLYQKQYEAGIWIDAELCILLRPCHCGQDHHPIKSKSELGDQVHCPVTWYGRLMLWGDKEPAFSYEELMEKCKDGFF